MVVYLQYYHSCLSYFSFGTFLDIGTGNGMAKSLLDSVGDPCSAFNAALAIIRGGPYSIGMHYCHF